MKEQYAVMPGLMKDAALLNDTYGIWDFADCLRKSARGCSHAAKGIPTDPVSDLNTVVTSRTDSSYDSRAVISQVGPLQTSQGYEDIAER